MRDIVLKKTCAKQYLSEPLFENDGGYKMELYVGDKLEEAAEVMCEVKRSDGTRVCYLGEADGGYARCTLGTESVKIPGNVEMRMSVVQENSSTVVIWVEGVVEKAWDGESVTNDDRYPILTSLLQEVSELKEAYEEGVESGLGAVTELREQMKTQIGGCTWYIDTDKVVNSNGEDCGTLSDCMTDDYAGRWFYAVTSKSTAGEATYPEKYVIDGANGHLSLRDYVIWTGDRLVHIPTFEAKSSTIKNSDGKYSPKSGVDGLMSSTDKAYLTDLINTVWGNEKMTVFPTPDPSDGWMVNWCREDGIYLGGIKKDCGGHPPVVNDNHTSWVVMVFNGMATDTNLNRNHRLQVAFDVVNSKIYMRRGWISDNSWAESWDEVGASQEITFHEEDALLNWVSKTGIHFCHAQAGNSANPVKDTKNLDYIVYTGKVFDGSNYTSKRFQEAVHVASGRTFYRTGEVTEGGSFGGFEWTELNRLATSQSDTLVITEIDSSKVNEFDVEGYSNVVVNVADGKVGGEILLKCSKTDNKVVKFRLVCSRNLHSSGVETITIGVGNAYQSEQFKTICTWADNTTHFYDVTLYYHPYTGDPFWTLNVVELSNASATVSGEEV